MLTSVGNVGDQGVEGECPGHGIRESFLELIHLEMLVTDTLLIATYTLDGQKLLLFGQETGVELTVRHFPKEPTSNDDSKQTGDEEDNLPRLDGRSIDVSPASDAVGDKASDDLSPAVEREPDSGA